MGHDPDIIEGPGGEPLIAPPDVEKRIASEPGLVILQAHNGRFLARPSTLTGRKVGFEIIARILDGSALWDGSRGRPLKKL